MTEKLAFWFVIVLFGLAVYVWVTTTMQRLVYASSPLDFGVYALSLPSAHHTRPPIVSWQMAKAELDRLKDFIHKNNPDAEIFIHPEPPEELLKKNGWERVPFTWRGNKIWIKREPKKNQINRTLVAA